jgi:hypothetical protein
MSRPVQIILTLFLAMFLGTAVSLALPVNHWLVSGVLMFIAIAQIMGAWLLTGHNSKALILMALVAYAPCTDTTSVHTPAGNCLDEGSGICGILLVKKGFNLASIDDADAYGTAKTAKDIVVIKDIEAFMPAGTQQTIPGLRGRVDRHGHWLFDMPFKHEGVDANLTFWNTINQSRNYGVVYITEEYKAFAPLDRDLEPVICSISAAPSGDQEFGKTRFFMGNVKWKHKDLPYLVTELTTAMLQPDFQV